MRRMLVAGVGLLAALLSACASTAGANPPTVTVDHTVSRTVATTQTVSVTETVRTTVSARATGVEPTTDAAAVQVCRNLYDEIANDGLANVLDMASKGTDPGQALWTYAGIYDPVDGSPGGPLLASQIDGFNSDVADAARTIAGDSLATARKLQSALDRVEATCKDAGYQS